MSPCATGRGGVMRHSQTVQTESPPGMPPQKAKQEASRGCARTAHPGAPEVPVEPVFSCVASLLCSLQLMRIPKVGASRQLVVQELPLDGKTTGAPRHTHAGKGQTSRNQLGTRPFVLRNNGAAAHLLPPA